MHRSPAARDATWKLMQGHIKWVEYCNLALAKEVFVW